MEQIGGNLRKQGESTVFLFYLILEILLYNCKMLLVLCIKNVSLKNHLLVEIVLKLTFLCKANFKGKKCIFA